MFTAKYRMPDKQRPNKMVADSSYSGISRLVLSAEDGGGGRGGEQGFRARREWRGPHTHLGEEGTAASFVFPLSFVSLLLGWARVGGTRGAATGCLQPGRGGRPDWREPVFCFVIYIATI